MAEARPRPAPAAAARSRRAANQPRPQRPEPGRGTGKGGGPKGPNPTSATRERGGECTKPFHELARAGAGTDVKQRRGYRPVQQQGESSRRKVGTEVHMTRKEHKKGVGEPAGQAGRSSTLGGSLDNAVEADVEVGPVLPSGGGRDPRRE